MLYLVVTDLSADGKDVVFGEAVGFRFSSITHDILGDPFWAVYRRGLEDAALRFGCQVHHRAPLQFSPARMADLIERAREEEPDGIIVTIPDAAAVEAPLRAAVAEGIPVIAVNAADPRQTSERIPYRFYIGADDGVGGRTAAERLLASGPALRGLTIDHYLIDNACHTARCDGFLRELASRDVPGERLRVPGDDHRASVELIREHLDRHADVDVICTLGPPGCRAVLDAVAQIGAQDRIRHGSFDLALDQLRAIKGGRLAFTIDSQQYLQGYLGIGFLHLLVTHGLTAAADIMTGPAIVDETNVDAALTGVRAGVR
ncbi:MAG: substrate-binding domain-containing protein [Solirubrobacteraceae bacterium]